MSQFTALVQPSSRHDFERRVSERQDRKLEALTRPVEGTDGIFWGATVRDISTKGIGLTLCYPFRAGTYLAVDLHDPRGNTHSLLTRVVHAVDQPDGTWHIGCEFVKPLTESDLDVIV
jgi:hypothetical protein